ncbi:MAG: hypothetical protein IJ693_08550 [Bacteroidaceae bacterium]|nr:hypothetical protein [Bacteroidaceae bacterium]
MKRLLLFLLPFFFVACQQENLYYSDYRHISHSRWDKNDTLIFTLPPSERDLDVIVTLSVRTTADASYNDLVTRLEVFSDARPLSSVHVPIALYKGTHPTGRGFSPAESSSRPQSLHLQSHHTYTFRVTHLMRLNPLPGVQDFSILVEEE